MIFIALESELSVACEQPQAQTKCAYVHKSKRTRLEKSRMLREFFLSIVSLQRFTFGP